MKTDDKIKALLARSGDPNEIDGDFIGRLVRDYESVRASHAGNLAAFAASHGPDEEPAEEAAARKRYLQEFLRFTAREMEVVLFQMIAKPPSPATSAEDRARAAVLFLWGAEQGFWKAHPQTVRLAKQLCYGTVAATPEQPAFDLHGTLRAVARLNGRVLRDALVDASKDASASRRDRLLAAEKVLQGIDAGLWDAPPEWKRA